MCRWWRCGSLAITRLIRPWAFRTARWGRWLHTICTPEVKRASRSSLQPWRTITAQKSAEPGFSMRWPLQADTRQSVTLSTSVRALRSVALYLLRFSRPTQKSTLSFFNDALMLGALFECQRHTSKYQISLRLSDSATWISPHGVRRRCRPFDHHAMKLGSKSQGICCVASPIQQPAAPLSISDANSCRGKEHDA